MNFPNNFHGKDLIIKALKKLSQELSVIENQNRELFLKVVILCLESKLTNRELLLCSHRAPAHYIRISVLYTFYLKITVTEVPAFSLLSTSISAS